MTEANLSLNNVKLKKDALIKLKLPINIELGEIRNLYIRVPWLKIGSQPVEVTIQGLQIIVSPQKKEQWRFTDIFEREYLEQTLLKITSQVEAELSADQQHGYFAKLATKVLDNIQVSIKDIHFRFEDHFATLDQSYSFGIVLKKLEIQTTNDQWAIQYVDRSQSGSNQNLYKMVVIEGLGIYLNHDEKSIIYQQTENQEMRVQLMEALVNENKKEVLQYLLQPMSLKLQVEQKNFKGAKKLSLNVELEKFHISFLRDQLRCLIKALELISEYQELQNAQLKAKKFKFLRPITALVTRQNAKQWWQYACQCIQRSNRAKNGSIREFNVPSKMISGFEQSFRQLLSGYYIKKEGQFKLMLPSDEIPMFKHIMCTVEPIVIKKWSKRWFEDQNRKHVIEKTKSGGGLSSWFFGKGSGAKDGSEEIMSQLEADAIEKEISNASQFDASKTNIEIQLLFRQAILDAGITNQQGRVEGLRIFAFNIKATFLQQPSVEMTFELDSSISDFGVDLYQFDPENNLFHMQDSIITSNKKIMPQNQDDQVQISVKKRPEDAKNVEFDVALKINPFLLVYNKEFLKRAILISKVSINLEAQNAAIDKIEDIREATSNSIYSLIYKKANRLRVNIASPVILLPLTATNDPTSPIWVLRLGDLNISSQDSQQTTSIQEYERYRIQLDSVRLQYFQSFDYWEKNMLALHSNNLREMSLLRHQERTDLVFSVIEECSIALEIGIKQKKAGGLLMMTAEQKLEHSKKPKLHIKGNTSDIRLNLSHSIFNKIVNIGAIFDLSQVQELQKPINQAQIESKQAVMKDALKIGQVQKRLEPLDKWENFFCILSGSHLYFYKDTSQIMPASHFYIKGAVLKENHCDIAFQNNLVLKNRFGQCSLALSNPNQLAEWAQKIRQRLFEIQHQEEEVRSEKLKDDFNDKEGQQKQALEKKIKETNHHAVMTQFEFRIPDFQALIVDELKRHQDWFALQFKGMSVMSIEKKTMKELKLEVKDISLTDYTLPINSCLIGKKTLKVLNRATQIVQPLEFNSLEVTVCSLDKSNPVFIGVNQLIIVNMSNLSIKFQPNSINELLKFVRNTKPDCSYNLITDQQEQDISLSIDRSREENESQKYQGDSSGQKSQQNERIKLNCGSIKDVLMQINVSIGNVSLGFLHQEYNMEMYRLDSSMIQIDYISRYDHMNFNVRFKDAFIIDMTCYPYTINPRDFAQNPGNFIQSQREMAVIKPVNTADFGLRLEFESHMPTCILKRNGFNSKLKLYIQPMVVEFFNEAFMRFFFYFFEQFLNALLLTDPYCNPVLVGLERLKKLKTIKKETIKKLVNFDQDNNIIDMDIKISDFAIKIPDRPQSSNFLSLQIKEFKVTQQIRLKAGRLVIDREKKLWCKSFRMQAEKAVVVFGGHTPLTDEAFNLAISFETLAPSPIIPKVDLKILEQASHLRMRFEPLQLTINQEVYTKILRILDLNINYTDFLEKEYYFFKFVHMEEYFKIFEDIVGMRLKIDFKCMSLRLEHIDQSFLSELMLLNLSIKMTKFRDFKNQMEIDIQNFFIFDSQQPLKIYKREIGEILQSIHSEDCVIQPKHIKKQPEVLYMQKQGSRQVSISMKMRPNGEKDIKVDIKGVRITIKPHLLMMVYYFLMNSFPEYQQTSVDKPSYINFDPEKAPKMDLKTSLKDCLLVFQNHPGLKTMACQGNIIFELNRQNIKEIKKFIDISGATTENFVDEELQFNAQIEEIKGQDDVISEDSRNSIDKKQLMAQASKVISDLAHSMVVKIEDFCPFVCSVNQLNENIQFHQIKKRQLLSNFNLKYIMNSTLIKLEKTDTLRQKVFEYGANVISEIDFSKMKAKISLQDLHLILQIVSFANNNIANEYVMKLEQIDYFIKNRRNNQRISVSHFDHQSVDFDRNETFKLDFGLNQKNQRLDAGGNALIEKDFNQDEEDEDPDENLVEVLNRQYEQTIASQMQRLRSTTKAFQKIAQKYTNVGMKNQKRGDPTVKATQTNIQSPNLVDKEDTTTANIVLSQSEVVLEEEQKRSTKLSYVKNTGSQGVVYSKQRDTTFKSAKGQLLEDEEQADFYSAQDENQDQIAILDEENFKSLYSATAPEEQALTQYEKAKLAINKEKVVFKSALQNVLASSQTVLSRGLQILFINDYDDVFCPILDVDIAEIEMKTENPNDQGFNEMNVDIPKMTVYYFNPTFGDWEPFIESFQVQYTYFESAQSLGAKQIYSEITFPKPIWINMTDQCFENLIETYYSWMETPPYQGDRNHKNRPKVREREKLIGSVNENDDAAGLIHVTVDSSLKKSQTGSINDDQNDLIENDSQRTHSERDAEQQQPLSTLNSDHFNKVSPYSIRNLSAIPIRVVKEQAATMSDILDQILRERDLQSSYMAKESVPHSNIIQDAVPADILIKPNEIIQYTVDIDKESNNFLIQGNNRKVMNAARMTRDTNNNNNQADSAERRKSIAASVTLQNHTVNTEAKKKVKNEEIVHIHFDTYQNEIQLDLNKLQQGYVELVPKMTSDPNYSLQLLTEKERLLQGSTNLTEAENSSSRASSKYSPSRKAKSPERSKQAARDAFKNVERAYYGVILKKMRKVLTLRQEYVISNKTVYDYVIKISHIYDKSVSKEYIIKADGDFGLNSNYFRNYSIQFRLQKNPTAEQPFKVSDEEEKKGLIGEAEFFSESILIEDFSKQSVDQGKVYSHDDTLFTFLKKQKGELEQTFDLVLLPPLSIKNCLPCKMEIKAVKYEGNDLMGDFAEEADYPEEEVVNQFDKQDEKHLHIFNFKGTKQDELYLSIRVSGFIWGRAQFKRKQVASDFEEDQEIKIRDRDGISTTISCRVMQKKAGLQLIFYAHTVLINQSNFNLVFFQNSLNKQVVPSQQNRSDLCIFSKDDSFLAGIGGRYSGGISIKNPGLTDYFSIQTSEQNVSLTQVFGEEDPKSKKLTRLSSVGALLEKKIDFVYKTYMSLISEHESIYTKIVCIAPKFVLVNKLKARVSIAQVGGDNLPQEILEMGDRKEWYWNDSHEQQKIVLKIEGDGDNADIADIADKAHQHNSGMWLWSAPIDINEQGIMAIAVKKDIPRFNNRLATKILRVQRKLIDGTTYIIIEEEDDTYPIFRIENLTDDIAVWYFQKDIHFESEACMLAPMTITPYAFSDTSHQAPQLQLFFTKSMNPQGLELDRTITHFVSFDTLGTRQSLEFTSNSQEVLINVTVKTDGCTRIIRIGNKPSAIEERTLADIRDQSIKRYRQSKRVRPNSAEAAGNKEEEEAKNQKVAYSMMVKVNEILVSFVAKITEREENMMRSMRKEIATFTVQDINYKKLYNTEENLEDIEFSIMMIQIDNQSSVTPLFPTVLQARTFKYNEEKPMIECKIGFKMDNPDITFIEKLEFNMQAIVVKLDDRFLGYALTYVNELLEKLRTNFTGLHPIFKKKKHLRASFKDEGLRQDTSFHGNRELITEGDNIIHINRRQTGQFGVQSPPKEGVKTVLYQKRKQRKDSNLSDRGAQADLFKSEERKSVRSSLTSKNSKDLAEFDQNQLKDDVNDEYRSWRTKKIDAINKRIFIKECKLSSVKIEISFLARKSVKNLGGKTSQSALHQTLDSWGLAVFNIDQVPVKVNNFEKNQIFGVQEDIIAMLSNHFLGSLKRNIVKLFFSFSLLGNPRKLVATVREGLSDFKNMPTRESGVRGFVKGSFMGTVSLFKSAFEGTFGVAEAFTGGVSKLALVLNQDGDYLGLREEKIITEKPRNIVEGVGFGCQTAVDSVLAGLLGVVKRPYIEASRNGFRGFLVGVYSGTTGLILKPFSGGLDLLSKTAEGIKNTAKIFEAQVYKERIRYPRTFYGYQEKIKIYNDQDAYIQGRILENLDGTFKRDHYLETIKYKEKNRTMFLVLSEEHLLLLDAAQKSMKWHIDSNKIDHVIKFKNGLIIELTEKYDGRTKVAIEITNGSQLDQVWEWMRPLGVSQAVPQAQEEE